jgi:cell division protein FtsI/penicillin-binding protein 2
LYKVIYEGDLPMLAISGYTLGWKTGTSQIAFKGRYQQGAGWTNGSFVGIVTKDNLKYVIAVQVRRPRTCQWWVCSAGKIFKDIAQYLIERDGIEK